MQQSSRITHGFLMTIKLFFSSNFAILHQITVTVCFGKATRSLLMSRRSGILLYFSRGALARVACVADEALTSHHRSQTS